jgi:hypothetical protein
MTQDSPPLADPSREEAAERIFSEYRHVSPGEWAARFAHPVGTSSFDQYRYRNEGLGDWIYALHEILRDPAQVEKHRRSYLSPEEYARIRDSQDEF